MNQSKTILSLLIAMLVGTPTLITPVVAQSEAPGGKFFCGQNRGAPATMANSSQGPVPVIRYVSTIGADDEYTPELRCQIISQRFQKFYTEGSLKFLTTGKINQQPVICVTPTNRASCSGSDRDLLITLKPSSDPAQTLRNLMAVRVGSAFGPLEESKNAQIYLNMDVYLNQAPAAANAVSIPPETPQPPPETDKINPSQPTPNLTEPPSLPQPKTKTESPLW
jgi:hypothetical protein